MTVILQDKSFYKEMAKSCFADDLSLDRFTRYQGWAGDDKAKAFYYYALNIAFAEALYMPFNTLEIVFRNKVHESLSKAYGEQWYLDEGIVRTDKQWLSIMDFATNNNEVYLSNIPIGKVVAGLSFGFWCSFLGSEYEMDIWRGPLKDIFPRDLSLTRNKVNKKIQPIRRLRNRVAHHEPILYWSLKKYYEDCLMLTEWLAPQGRIWIESHSVFNNLYAHYEADLRDIHAFEKGGK